MEPCTSYQNTHHLLTVHGNRLTAVGNLLLARVKWNERHKQLVKVLDGGIFLSQYLKDDN